MLRWSSVRDCARKAVYEATGAPARERYPREERILFRGKTLGRDYADMLAASHGPDEIERERKVIWPLGVGHIDVYVKQTKTVIEVLSSAHASEQMIRSKLVQAVGYALHDPEATNVCLVILNPSDYSEERVIVTPTSPQWESLVEEVEERIAQVLAWRDGGDLPGRVCKKPGDAHGHFCLHADHCFEGFTPDVAADLASEDAQTLAIQLAHVKAKRREIKQSDKLLENEQKDIQAELAEFVPAGEWQVGGYLVKRSARSRSSFSLTRAEADSRFHPDLLAEFTKHSSFDVWDVERTGDPMLLDDGPVPF